MMALVTWLPEVKRKGAVVLRVDNIGFCYAWRNGHGQDLYIYTITKAMIDIARMAEVRVEVDHVLRRSEVGDEIVDNLSKNAVGAEEKKRLGMTEVATGSIYLANWLKDPSLRWDLGRRIVEDLGHEQIVPERNYKKDMRIVREEMGWKLVSNKWVKK